MSTPSTILASREELKILCDSLKGKVSSFAQPALTRALHSARGALKSALASEAEIQQHLEALKQLCKA